MSISRKIAGFMDKGSWIRRMFEEGNILKARYGVKNVYDFSLGNPKLPPPPAFQERLRQVVMENAPGCHAYMPNAGYKETRDAVAAYLSNEHGQPFTGQDIVMTCGAAGAINTALKAILDPGDEVIIIAPYFAEYTFYIDNHNGVCRIVPSRPDFLLDVKAIDAAITPRTKAILINSPNNPTGQVYPADNVRELADMLKARAKGQTIYLIADEPYRKIVYDGTVVPSLFAYWPETILATSHSKDISIPGERIGYLAVHPAAADKQELLAAITFCNRILGFVNAPAIMQHVIRYTQGLTADLGEYARKRDLICNGLRQAGYEFVKPKGAFYLFPRSPIADEVVFIRKLAEERILTVPGSGFGVPGYFRISFCVDDCVIEKALPGFAKVLNSVRG